MRKYLELVIDFSFFLISKRPFEVQDWKRMELGQGKLLRLF